MLEFVNYLHLSVEQVRIENASAWTMRVMSCVGVVVDGVSIKNPVVGHVPPESIPARCASPEKLPEASIRAQWEYRMQQDASPDTEPLWRQYLTNHFGCLRMIGAPKE